MEDGHHTGVAAMVRCALYLEECGALALNIGHNAFAPEESCRLEGAGAHLLYCIVLDGAGGLSLSVVPLDSPAPPDLLLRAVDDPAGWAKTMRSEGGVLTTPGAMLPCAGCAAPWNRTKSKPCNRAPLST
jgi:hypothetical protein